MPLKVTLKPREKAIIGGAVVTNAGGKTELIIENNVPILRQKDVLTAAQATTPCKRIYLVIQLMYVDEKNLALHQRTYWSLVHDVVQAAPSMVSFIDQISARINEGNYFSALKLAKRLIAYEAEVISHVRSNRKSL